MAEEINNTQAPAAENTTAAAPAARGERPARAFGANGALKAEEKSANFALKRWTTSIIKTSNS